MYVCIYVCDLGQDPDQCFAYPTCPQRRARSKFQFSKIRPTGNEIRDLPPPSDRCQVPSSEGKASPPLPEQSMLFPEDFPFLEPITSSIVASSQCGKERGPIPEMPQYSAPLASRPNHSSRHLAKLCTAGDRNCTAPPLIHTPRWPANGDSPALYAAMASGLRGCASQVSANTKSTSISSFTPDVPSRLRCRPWTPSPGRCHRTFSSPSTAPSCTCGPGRTTPPSPTASSKLSFDRHHPRPGPCRQLG